jgi:HK97 family phage prohead protease
MSNQPRRSILSLASLRADAGADGAAKLSGYAAVFDSETVIHDFFGGYREVVRAGAFTRALSEAQDVRCLVDHIPALVLGRTKSGTLRLTEDETGLRFEVDMPATGPANDLLESIRRGDVSGCSFAFDVKQHRITIADDPKDDLRELLDVDLFDVSIVTYPAYSDTSVEISERSSRPWRAAKSGHSVADSRRKTTLLRLKSEV